MDAVFSFYDGQWDTNCRFYSRKMLLSSLILSTLQAKQFFDKVILVCNKSALEKIKFLELPFDIIHSDLVITPKEKAFFSSPKLKSFFYFDKPFCHLDYDLFLWNDIKNLPIKYDILVDTTEIHWHQQSYYKKAHEDFFKNGKPHLLPEIPTQPKNYFAPNTGLIHVKNISFIKKYATNVLNYINTIDKPNCKFHINNPAYIEQFYLKHYAKANNVKLASFTDIYGLEEYVKKPFLHLVFRKSNPNMCEYILNETRSRHYEYYKKIENI
jgi:hypothetical protein